MQANNFAFMLFYTVR